MFEDKTLVCKDCGEEFVFTAREQEFYESKGFVNEPSVASLAATSVRMQAELPEKCTRLFVQACGGVATVPFVPRDDRPVYCSECFAKMKEQENADSAE